MFPAGLGGFAAANLGEGGWNPSDLPISRVVGAHDIRRDFQPRIDAIERGDFGGQDPAMVLFDLNRDMIAQIARVQTSSGIPIREDLEAPATQIVPLDTPLRNKLPRTPGSSTQSSWYQETTIGGGYGVSTTVTTGASSTTQSVGNVNGMTVGMQLYFATANVNRTIATIASSTSITLTATVSTTTGEAVSQGPYGELGQSPVQTFFPETGAPATASATYTKVTEAYCLLGTIYSITGLAMAAGATFDNQLAMEKMAAIRRLMLSEENALINSSTTNIYAPFGNGTTAYGYAGLLALITTANGTPGQQVQASVGALTISHVDAQLSRIHANGGMNLYMIVNAQEAQSLAHLASSSSSPNRILGTADGKLVVGATASAYVHPVTGQLVPIMVSRFMPAGTIAYCSEMGPNGQPAMDVRVLPQVQLPELAPNVNIQGYVAQEIAPSITAPQEYPGIVSVYSVPRMKNANVFAVDTGLTAV